MTLTGKLEQPSLGPASRPITVALVDDYDVVLLGVAKILDNYGDRVVITEINANKPVQEDVDIVLYDSFAQAESDHADVSVLVANPHTGKVVFYTWTFHPELIESAKKRGVSGYLSKSMSGCELVDALERIHAGELVVSDSPGPIHPNYALDWPGQHKGLTDRESEVLALITQGLDNAGVAAQTYLSPNTIKSYIRSVYRKIDVSSRTQAVLWGVDHGFSPDHRRITPWQSQN